MSILHAIILGIVEGVTEFLPISSTAHLIIASRILHIAQSDFVKMFEIVIQLGAIAAVAVLYFKTLITKPKLIGKILAAFIPTSIIGLAVYSFAKKYILGNLGITVWALIVGGVVIILFEIISEKRQKINKLPPEELEVAVSYPAAVWMGICQAIAIIPGVSRSAATILGGRAWGIARKEVVEFSFLLAAPTMLAAAALDIYKNPQAILGGDMTSIIVGLLVSFVVAYISMKWLLKYIQTHSFKVFGVYRIVVGVVIWMIFLR